MSKKSIKELVVEKTTSRLVVNVDRILLETYKKACPEEKLKYTLKDKLEEWFRTKINERVL